LAVGSIPSSEKEGGGVHALDLSHKEMDRDDHRPGNFRKVKSETRKKSNRHSPKVTVVFVALSHR
jgi:hypothetical protein